jgi:hypothetical protein
MAATTMLPLWSTTAIYAPASNDPRSIQMTVMRMTAEGVRRRASQKLAT